MNSILAQVDGPYVAAQVRLVRQVHKGAFLLLEGSDDARFFEGFIERSACQIEIGYGKENVVTALDLLEDEGFAGVVAAVDADFDRVLGRDHPLEGLCKTDYHDLDVVVFQSEALNRYVAEHGDKTKISSQFNGSYGALREKIIRSCEMISLCRLVSERRALNLKFKGIEIERFISKSDLKLDYSGYFSAVINNSKGTTSVADIIGYVKAEAAMSHELLQVTQGHDLAIMFGVALRELIGSRRDVHTWGREIESGLRLAFDWRNFVKTELYASLRAWEQQNRSYCVLKKDPFL
jgi:hypothetical protein